jgi:predicted cupin superfamily sugar epimerase
MISARAWIDHLQLKPHPEGGYFRESYRSPETIARAHLPARFGGDRAFATAIYYLLQAGDFSAFHRIKADEGWHFYDGVPLTVHVLGAGGTHSALKLGRDFARGELPQAVVRAGDLFAAELEGPAGYALVGCTVAPGFDFADFELPPRHELLARYPQHKELIRRLTR